MSVVSESKSVALLPLITTKHVTLHRTHGQSVNAMHLSALDVDAQRSCRHPRTARDSCFIDLLRFTPQVTLVLPSGSVIAY